MKIRLPYVIVLLGGCALGVYAFTLFKEQLTKVSSLKDETDYNAIPDVTVVKPKLASNQHKLTLPGTLDAWYQAKIYPQATGYVKMWYKDYGAVVKAGDVLAEINTPMLDAEYNQAKADYEAKVAKYNLAKISAERWHNMKKANAVSGQSVSVADANLQSGYAEMQAAAHTVAKYEALERFKTIVAPFDGVVTARNINVGDYVRSGTGEHGEEDEATQMFTVSDMHKMRLFVSVPQNFATILQPGMTANITLPQDPGKVYKADFLTIARSFNSDTRTAITEFVLDNPDHALWPGTFASVHFTAPVPYKSFEIPTATLVFQEPGLQVAVIDKNNHVHFKDIKVGTMADTSTTVTEGVKEDDVLIKNPPSDLLEGQTVRITKPMNGYEGNNSPADEEVSEE
ncbi:Acriflavin resistance periplasmic protein [Granulibacter bethesdensis]|uniref:Acriflavin resistance periplasmic protein n=1 Tax=Granulibacter bethesdensis TaxID=364410 RepID=A0AAC9KCG0_9PROT|nr:efflux RND transporter periplasmic adaptor subunit [Granulibacter bethesdensis]APH53453.1 Acriflavin resistance periplasmic protein [Granulibacter bethesdensis]APH61031.1 Acriflavin resistance periplasmic protein [Granulibacter bethesdensis]